VADTTIASALTTAAAAKDGHALACTVFRQGKAVGAPDDLSKINEILLEPDTLVWFDAIDPTPDDLGLLQREFDLHPLAIEDAVQPHQRPKIESYGSYWFLVVLGVTIEGQGQAVFHEIAIFATEKFLVTVRHQPAYPLDEIENRWGAHPERLRRGGGFLLYTILDTVVDGYIPVAETFEDRVDSLEEMLFEDRPLGTAILREIFTMKQDAQQFRHAAMPMRDILNPIIRGDIDMFPADVIVYFRDVYDHAIRVIDQLDTLRDLMASALEIHLSVVANRQNEVAKQLTIIATIFLPLSFLVGFFGQNFDFLVSHITGPGAFFLLGLGTEVAAVLGLLALFKKRGWF
jgi:magnesium transporter